MSNIISLSQKKIINGLYQEVYDARTLHTNLQSKKKFADWIKSRLQDFVEGIDFISFSPNSEKPQNGRPTTEYTLTIDTAKQLALMERTEVGKQIRLAFIEAEKALRKIQTQPPQIQLPQNYVEALKCLVIAEEEKLALENTVKEKEDTIARQQTSIENAKELFKEIADKTGCVKFKVCASLLNIKESELKAILRQNKWIYLKKLFPTTDGRSNGYVKLQAETFDVKLKSGSKVQKSSPAFYITEKGYCKILEQVSGVILN